jgi:hypothetical protein
LLLSFIETEKPRQVNVILPEPRRASRDRLYDYLALAILLIVAVLIAFTFRDYSISTDEEVQSTYGRLLLNFYLSGLTDTRAFTYENLYLYGGLFDLIAAIIEPFSPLSDFDTRHLLSAIFGVLGIVATWRLARLLAGPRAGLWAVILLVLCPPFYGAMFNNTKDIPFATGMTWMLYLSCRLVASLPRPPWRLVVWLGLAAGASLGLRVGAVLGGLYLLPVFALQAIGIANSSGWPASARFIGTLIVRLFPAVAIAIALMAVLWPWSVMAPGNILVAVHDLTGLHVQTIFNGRIMESYDAPRSYVPIYLLLKLPETLLASLVAALITAAAFRRNVGHFTTTRQQWLLVILAASAPVLYAVLARPAIYNGMRHFLFIVPPLCVIGAGGVERLLMLAGKRAGRWGVIAMASVLAAALVKDTVTMVMLHPHQYVYYNLLIGGVRGADNRYELDYWSNFTQEAIDQLARYIAAENGGRLPDRRFSVDLCTSWWSSWPLRAYAPPQFQMTEGWRSADFIIATTNTDCDGYSDGRTIIKVERMGVVLGVVKDRRNDAPPKADVSQGGR